MDSPPRPQRRFSRWQTTRRTFVLGGVTYVPPNQKQTTQDNQEQPEIVKEKIRKANGGVNDKINKNSLFGHSTIDDVAKPSRQSLSSVKKSTIGRKLALDTSKSTENKHGISVSAEVIQPTLETAHDDPILSDKAAADEERLHQNGNTVIADRSEICLATDPSLSLELLSQHERVDGAGFETISDETSHQNNKCALSNISQNTSAANKSTKIQTRSSQTKAHVSLNSSAQSVHGAGIIASETNRRKRQIIDDGESSDTSSTDKENKDKDPTNSDVPSQIKKLKQDGALQNLSTSTAKKTAMGNVNISQNDSTLNQEHLAKDLSARRSTLRNRSLLTSPKTLLMKQQYPVFHSSEKKSGSEKGSSKRKDKLSVAAESSSSKKGDSKKHSPVSEVKSKQQNTMKASPKKISVQKNPSKFKSRDHNDSSHEFKKQNKSLHKNKYKNTSEAATEKTSTILHTPADKQAKCVSIHEFSSTSERTGLRDRSLLPTPEQVQQKGQYPISFYFSSRNTSIVGNVSSHNKHDKTSKKMQNLETVSSLKRSESPSSKNIKVSCRRTYENSNSNIDSRKNSLTPKNFPINSQVSSKELSQQRKSGKLLKNSQGSKTAATVVSEVNTSVRIQTGNGNVKYPDRKENKLSFVKKHLKTNHAQELEGSALVVQSTLPLLPTHVKDVSNSVNLFEYKQKSSHVKNTKTPVETAGVKTKVNDAVSSLLSTKLSSSKAKSRQYSLPRRPVKRSSTEKINLTTSNEGCSSPFSPVDVSVHLTQLSATIVDTSREQSRNIAFKKPPPQLRQLSKADKAQPAGTKQFEGPGLSINDTLVGSQKQLRKRKLLEEMNRAEEVERLTANNEVLLWCEDGLSRRVSDVTVYDVILQAMMESEERLLNETEDDSVEHRLVRKVMGRLQHRIKTMITKVKETKDLQHEIRLQNRRIRKLMSDIREQRRIAQEKHKRISSDQDVELSHYEEVLKGYRQLMQAYIEKS